MDIVLFEYPAIPLVGIYPEKAPTCHKDTCSTMFIAAIFIIARSLKQTRCPSRVEWIHIYTLEYYSAIKSSDFMKLTDNWMELENMSLSEVTQSQKNTHSMYSLF